MIGEQPGWGGFTGQSTEEYQGYGWSQALHPDDAKPTVEAWEQAVAERRMVQERPDLRTVLAAALEASRPLVDAVRHELLVELPDEPVWLEAAEVSRVLA